MEGENIVKLHATKNSAFSFRVELALKIKGIPYEYVDEDLRNKSELLLKYNPVHKKVPILVHNGQPLVESLVILEYIDEIWKDNGPQLLPQDPYTRAKVRFWASFLHQQVFAPIFQVITEEGEAQEKAIKEEIDALKVVEEGMLEFFPTTPITNENQLGFLDIVICSVLGHHKAIEEAIGVKLVDPERNPLVFSWMEALTELPAVKELGFLDTVTCSVLGAHKAIEEVIGLKLIDPERNPLVFSWMEAKLDLPGVKEIRPTHQKAVTFIQFIQDNFKSS